MKNFMREKRTYCGEKYCEVDIIPRTIFQEKIVKGKRAKRKRESAPKQKNLNDKNCKRYVTQLINGNFDNGDLHVTCTYKDDFLPETIDEAEREITNFLRRVSHKRKKEKLESLKYILVTEYSLNDLDKVTRVHHHLIINKGLSRDEIETLWSKKKKSLGYVNADRLQTNENGLEAISKYLTKGKVKKGKKKWSSSRNLKRPESIKNDYKYSKRKIEKLIKENDITFWEKQYPGYKVTRVQAEYNDFFGWSVYLKMWKKDEEDLQ